MDFADRLKMLRENEGWTQGQLADKTGINRSTLMNYENSYRLPKIDIAIKLAKAFNMSVEELFGDVDKEINSSINNPDAPALMFKCVASYLNVEEYKNLKLVEVEKIIHDVAFVDYLRYLYFKHEGDNRNGNKEKDQKEE